MTYVRDRDLFLSRNTDGPENPLSKVYSRDEARTLFQDFDLERVRMRFLNLRIYPYGDRLAQTALARRLERRIGCICYVEATKRG